MGPEIICIDMGTANTRVWIKSKGNIFDEPTCIALDKKTGEVLEIGYLASYSAGRSPLEVEITYPILSGVVADVDLAAMFLKQIFLNQHMGRKLKHSIIYAVCPNQITNVERNALLSVFSLIGAKKVHLVSTSKASALGAGVDMSSPRGILTLDIGAGISDCGALVLGQNAASLSIKVAGNSYNEAIKRFLVRYKNILIGDNTAQTVKMRIGNVSSNAENQFFEVAGKDIVTGLPTTTIVSTEELKPCLLPLIQQIADLVIDVIKSVKPELAADLTRTGILVTGSGALLGGTKDYLENVLKMPIHFVSDMANGPIIGLRKLCESK